MTQKQKHHRAIPYAEMAKVFLLLANGHGSKEAKLCLLFTILTGVRGGESRLSRWEEIDIKARLWRIPAARTKTGEAHTQPLSVPALAMLQRARSLGDAEGADASGLIFPSPQKRRREPLSEAALMTVLERNGLAERMTVHGCRASFKTWADECTDADHAVKEMCLGHLVGNKVERAYGRGELIAKRRALMDAWADYCMRKGNDDP